MTDWKTQIEAVATDVGEILVVLDMEESKRVFVLYDAEGNTQDEGIRLLFEDLLPEGYSLELHPDEVNPELLESFKKGSPIYVWNRLAFMEKKRILSAANTSYLSAKDIKMTDGESDAGKFAKFALLVLVVSTLQFNVLLFLIAMREEQHGEAEEPLGLFAKIISFGLIVLLTTGILKFLRNVPEFFGSIMYSSGTKYDRGFSKEKAMAAKGERREAINLLEDRYDTTEDLAPLREAIRIALRPPSLAEDARRLIQKLLKSKTLPKGEKEYFERSLDELG